MCTNRLWEEGETEWSPAQKVDAVSEFWPLHVCIRTILLESVPRIQIQGVVQVKEGTSKSLFCAANHWSLMDHHGLNTSYRLFEEETNDVNIINQLK